MLTPTDPLSSSASLIRTLKSPGLPARDKVALALAGWLKEDLYVPGKRDVLLDWLTTEMAATGGGPKGKGKENVKGKSSKEDVLPILSASHWSLLLRLLPTSHSAPSSAMTQTLPSALSQLLPLCLRQITALATAPGPTLLDQVAKTAERLLVLLRLSSESLLDLFGEVLQAWHHVSSRLEDGETTLGGWEDMVAVVARALEATLSNNLHRKKLAQTHLKSNHFFLLLSFLYLLPSVASPLQSLLLALQSSLLFPPEILKTLSTPPASATTPKLPSGMISTQPVNTPADSQASSLHNTLTSLLSSPSSSSVTLAHLPSLFSSYTTLLSIHRHTLFPLPPSSRTPAEVHASDAISAATLRFLRELIDLVGMNKAGRERWECLRGIWQVVDERGKVGRGYEVGPGAEGWGIVGNGLLEAGVERLNRITSMQDLDTSASSERDAILQTFTIILELDYDLISHFLSEILVSIAHIPTPHSPSLSLLMPLLSYHNKTRTLPSLFVLLSSTITALPLSSPGSYVCVAKGPLFGLEWTAELGKAIRSFLGVQVQVGEGMSSLRGTMLEVFSKMGGVAEAADEERKKKKRKVAADFDGGSATNEDSLAKTLSLLSRLLLVYATSASSLLIGNLPSPLLSTLTDEYRAMLDLVARPLIEFGLQSRGKENDLVLGAGLKVFEACRGVLGEELEGDLAEQMLERLKDTQGGGEGKFDIVSGLLRTLLRSSPACEAFLNALLAIIDQQNATHSWTGWGCDLGEGTRSTEPGASLPVAIWALLTNGGAAWLSVIDQLASPSQSQALANFIIQKFHSVSVTDAASSSLITAHSLTTQLLSLPSFYELPNLRHALISDIDRSSAQEFSTSSTAEVVRPFEVLLVLPVEYIPRAQRVELVKRALALEKGLKLQTTTVADVLDANERERERAVLRRFVESVGSEMAGNLGLPIQEAALDYLMMQSPLSILPSSSPSSPAIIASLHRSTTSILTHAFRSILKHSPLEVLARVVGKAFHEDVIGPFEDALEDLGSDAGMDVDVQDAEEDDDGFELDFPVRSCLLLVQTIVNEVRDPKSLDASLRLPELVANLHDILENGVRRLVSSSKTGLDLLPYADLVGALTTTLKFKIWFSKGHAGDDLKSAAPEAADLPLLLVQAALRLSSTSGSGERSLQSLSAFASAVLDLASASTLTHPSEDRGRGPALEMFSASWLALAGVFGARGLSLFPLEPCLLAFAKDLTSLERTNLVISLAETLASKVSQPSVLRASALALNSILRDGSDVYNKTIIGKVLSSIEILLASQPDVELLASVASIIECICSDKAAYLQLPDATSLFSILSLVASPRSSSTRRIPSPPRSVPHIYLSLAASATSLVRHRRDLVSALLPHLSALLILLLSALRSPRPSLGGRQLRILSDSLPCWLNVSTSPLGIAEARAFARLLTSLTVKTIPRLPPSTASISAQRRASSLATPLSKHAPYLLLAYVRMLTDLDTVVSPAVRHELEPGVGSICEIVGERDRDAVMIGGGLDGGGKGVLKMVWEGWEKGKYAGTG